MTAYVLIVTSVMVGYVSGIHVTSQEFSTKDTCEAAQRQLSTQAKDLSGDRHVRSFCIPK